jgi:hypothetical protein
MKTVSNDDLVVIYAGSSIEAEIVKSILKDYEIEAFLKDENMGVIAPWHISAGGAGAVKIIINSKDYEAARQIVEKFEQSKQ